MEWNCTIPGKRLARDSAWKSSHHLRRREQTCKHGSQLQQVKQTHMRRHIRSPPTHTQGSICLFLCSGQLTSVATHILAHTHTQKPWSCQLCGSKYLFLDYVGSSVVAVSVLLCVLEGPTQVLNILDPVNLNGEKEFQCKDVMQSVSQPFPLSSHCTSRTNESTLLL